MRRAGDWLLEERGVENGDEVDDFKLLSLLWCSGFGAPGRIDFFLGIASAVRLALNGELSEVGGSV